MTTANTRNVLGISKELADGIRRYDAMVAEYGYGSRIAAVIGGVRREGVLRDGGACQPTIVQDDGRRYRLPSLWDGPWERL